MTALLAGGADPCVQDDKGATPYHLSSGMQRIHRALARAGGDDASHAGDSGCKWLFEDDSKMAYEESEGSDDSSEMTYGNALQALEERVAEEQRAEEARQIAEARRAEERRAAAARRAEERAARRAAEKAAEQEKITNFAIQLNQAFANQQRREEHRRLAAEQQRLAAELQRRAREEEQRRAAARALEEQQRREGQRYGDDTSTCPYGYYIDPNGNRRSYCAVQ